MLAHIRTCLEKGLDVNFNDRTWEGDIGASLAREVQIVLIIALSRRREALSQLSMLNIFSGERYTVSLLPLNTCRWAPRMI